MDDAEYDRFAQDLTLLCRQYDIRVEIDEAVGCLVLTPGFFESDCKYVVGHDCMGGVPVKALALVLDEPEKP